MSEKLAKVDSAVQGLSSSPPKDAKDAKQKKAGSSAGGVMNINDLGMWTAQLRGFRARLPSIG